MNAIAKKPGSRQSNRPSGTKSFADGSMTVNAESLTQFGGGSLTAGKRDLRILLGLSRTDPVFNGPTAKPASVRLAMPKDEQACLDLLMIDVAAAAEGIAPVSAERVLHHIQLGTRQRGGFVPVIDGPDGRPVAIAIVIPQQWWFSNGWFLSELVMFVHPDHRRSQHAADLMNFCKWLSDSMSEGSGYRTWLTCGVVGTHRLQAKTALYRRRFYQVGASFIYPVPPQNEN